MNGEIEIDGSIQELITSAFRTDHSFLTNNPFLKHLPSISHSEKNSERDIQKH